MIRKNTTITLNLWYLWSKKLQRIKLFFLEEMGGPEKGRFGGYITTETLLFRSRDIYWGDRHMQDTAHPTVQP